MGLVCFTSPRRFYSALRQPRACSPQQSPAFHRARAKRAAAAGPAPSAPGRPHPGPHPRRCPASPVLLLQQLLELLGGTRRRHLPRRHGPAAAVAAGRGRGTGSRGGGPRACATVAAPSAQAPSARAGAVATRARRRPS